MSSHTASARVYHLSLSRSLDALQSIRNCIPAWVQHHPRDPRRCRAFSRYGHPPLLHFRSGSFQPSGLDRPIGSRLVDVHPYRAGIQALPHPRRRKYCIWAWWRAVRPSSVGPGALRDRKSFLEWLLSLLNKHFGRSRLGSQLDTGSEEVLTSSAGTRYQANGPALDLRPLWSTRGGSPRGTLGYQIVSLASSHWRSLFFNHLFVQLTRVSPRSEKVLK